MLCYPGLHEAVAERAERFLLSGQRVLDLGCGRGALSLRLHNAGLMVDAVDMLDFCMCKKEVGFHKTSVESYLEKDTGPYDAVSLVEVLEHLENPFQTIRSSYRALKENGVMFVSTPNIDSDFSRAWFLLKGRHWFFGDANVNTDGHINPIHQFQIEFLFKEMSMTIIDEFSVGAHPSGSWRFRALQALLRKYQSRRGLSPNNGVVRCIVARKVTPKAGGEP
jgi:2-polyprenyl-3-methyl-5-hydroxy-6-metoxy-1,4-benzoquinol methylase